MIKSHVDKERNLTTFLCSEKVEIAEIHERLRAFYGGRPTLHTVWDFSEADVSGLTREDLSGLAGYVKSSAHSRGGGRTSLVFEASTLMELGPMLEGIAEIEVPNATIKIHTDLPAALAWIAAAGS